jgi:hypothetical protein
VTWQSEDRNNRLELPLHAGFAATRILSAYFRGDLGTLNEWPWQPLDLADSPKRNSESVELVHGSDSCTGPEPGNEYLYVLANESMPGMVKIGRSDRDAVTRAKELSYATGVPTEFRVIRNFRVRDSVALERRVHERLISYRVSSNREFFSVDAETAINVIEEALKLLAPATETQDRLFDAIQLALRKRRVWPGMLAGYLKMPYDEADVCMAQMRNLGVVDLDGNVNPNWRASPAAPLTPAEEVEHRALEVQTRRTVIHRQKSGLRSTSISTPPSNPEERVSIRESHSWLWPFVLMLVILWIIALIGYELTPASGR